VIWAALVIFGVGATIVWSEVSARRSQGRARCAQLRVESHIRLRSYDACEVCHGMKGGVPGNENDVEGVVCCDYCYSDGSVARYIDWKAGL
jgi:hypothetical protein